MANPKTYWHLMHQRRMPTEYELLSSKLHYYVGKGFEVNMPVSGWYQKYQQGSPLTCSDWEKFADPRETTYTSYTGLQKDSITEASYREYAAALASPPYPSLKGLEAVRESLVETTPLLKQADLRKFIDDRFVKPR